MPRAVLPMIERKARSKYPSCSASLPRESVVVEFFIASAGEMSSKLHGRGGTIGDV